MSKSRQALTCLSDWGRLLAYHDSVPQAAEDLWKQAAGEKAEIEETEAVRRKLIKWYAERMRELKVIFDHNQNAVGSVVDRIQEELQRCGHGTLVDVFGRVVVFRGTRQVSEMIKALLEANSQVHGRAIEKKPVREFQF